jgi:hypothetical protein
MADVSFNTNSGAAAGGNDQYDPKDAQLVPAAVTGETMDTTRGQKKDGRSRLWVCVACPLARATHHRL